MSIAKGVSPILCSLSGNRKPLGVSSTSAHSCMYAPSEVSSCGSDSAYPHFSDGALNNARVVLVGTQHAGNVGSVCRAAVNFGEQSVRISMCREDLEDSILVSEQLSSCMEKQGDVHKTIRAHGAGLSQFDMFLTPCKGWYGTLTAGGSKGSTCKPVVGSKGKLLILFVISMEIRGWGLDDILISEPHGWGLPSYCRRKGGYLVKSQGMKRAATTKERG